MAGEHRNATDYLIRYFAGELPGGEDALHRCSFYRLVRLFEQSRPDLPRVGQSSLPSQEILRFGQKPFVTFAPSVLQAFEAGDGAPKLSVNFMGLLGPNGPMPLCFTEYALQRQGSRRMDEQVEAAPVDWEFQVQDFLHFTDFARLLARHESRLTLWIWEQLPLRLRNLMQDLDPTAFLNPPLREDFLKGLGAVLHAPDLARAARDAGVELGSLAVRFEAKPNGSELCQLNRQVLATAFPKHLRPYRVAMVTRFDFKPWDFEDLAAVIRAMQQGTTPFASAILAILPSGLRVSIRDCSPGSFLVEPLLSHFMRAINDLLITAELCDDQLLAGLELTPEDRKLAQTKPQGLDRARVNRALLEAGFAIGIRPMSARRSRDDTLSAFLDVFHHRMISYLYRAWAIHQKTVDLDRPDNWIAGEHQKYPTYLGSLVGIGMDSLRRRDAVPDFARLHYAGLLAGGTRHAEGLESLLKEYFGIPAQVQTFRGRWIELPPENECRMGASPATGMLGVNAIAGTRVWDVQLGLRIRLGPMHLADFQRLLPKRLVVCSSCSQPLLPWGEQAELVNRASDCITARLRQLGGCPRCHYGGPQDWDYEHQSSRRADGTVVPVRLVVCKKCRTPFGPQELQQELKETAPEQIPVRLARTPGCQQCAAVETLDWTIISGGSFERLRCWIKSYLGDTYLWDLQLVLKKEDVPESQLGQSGRLGQTTWIKAAPLQTDAEDLIIEGY